MAFFIANASLSNAFYMKTFYKEFNAVRSS